MTQETHTQYDTISHEHMSSLVRWDQDNIDGLYFMLVECRDGRYFLESEFNDEEYDQFEDIFNDTIPRPVVFYPNRLAALKRALEIANALCPLATKTELLEAMEKEVPTAK